MVKISHVKRDTASFCEGLLYLDREYQRICERLQFRCLKHERQIKHDVLNLCWRAALLTAAQLKAARALVGMEQKALPRKHRGCRFRLFSGWKQATAPSAA